MVVMCCHSLSKRPVLSRPLSRWTIHHGAIGLDHQNLRDTVIQTSLCLRGKLRRAVHLAQLPFHRAPESTILLVLNQVFCRDRQFEELGSLHRVFESQVVDYMCPNVGMSLLLPERPMLSVQ